MKLNNFQRFALFPALAGCTLLSSCHSDLHRAVEENNIYAVRREIAYANTLSPRKKLEHLKGAPPASNLWWIVPTGMITVPIDLCLLFGTLGLYAATEDYWLSDILWYNFYNNTPDAVESSFWNHNYDITYELMEAGASPSYITSDWMYKNYWRYKPVVVEAPEPPKPKPKPKSKPTTTTKSIGVGESIAKPGS